MNYFILHLVCTEDTIERNRVITMNKILNKIQNLTSEEILEQYHNHNMIPVDVADIAQKIGIQLKGIDFTDLEKEDAFVNMVKARGHILGAVFIDDEDTLSVLYQNKFSEKQKGITKEQEKENLKRRQRFTIAHELAHCCLDMKEDRPVHLEYRTDMKECSGGKECNANIFAGELLIPEYLLNKIYSAYGQIGRLPTIQALADIFAVSKTVMRARLDYLKKGYIVIGSN